MESQKISKDVLYPLNPDEQPPAGLLRENLRVRWTGEDGIPYFGEWYLSGCCTVEGYQSGGEVTDFCHIGELVEVEVVATVREVEVVATVRVVRVIPRMVTSRWLGGA